MNKYLNLLRNGRKFNLLTKLSLLVTSAVLLVVVALGLYFNDFLKDRFLDDTQQRMQRGFVRLAYNLKEIEHELRDGIAFIGNDEKTIASVDLINKYQDKSNYNLFLIDEEKKSVVSELLSRVKLSFNSDISIYDQNGELIAFVSKDDEGYQLNFFSYEAGQRKLFRRYEQHAVYSPAQALPKGIAFTHKDYYTAEEQLLHGSSITYHRQGDDVVIRSHQSIVQGDTGKVIAHIEMSRILDKQYFANFSRDIDLDISLSFDVMKANAVLGENLSVQHIDITQSDQEYLGVLKKEIVSGVVYFVARLDKAALNAMLNASRSQFLLLLVAVAVTTLLLMRYLIRRRLELPLNSLMEQIRKIERQDYSASDEVRTGDELEDISASVNQLALAVHDRESQLQQARKEQEYLSDHDALTGLPNRRHFSKRLEHALDSTRENRAQFAVMFLDLDQFKLVNDTLGHHIGDELLVQVANRLVQQPGSGQTLARIGGDEFNILIEGVGDIQQLKEIVGQYLAQFHEPFLCAGLEIDISASIGVATFPRDGEDSVSLIKHADLAMYKSKDKGRNNYSFYSDDLAEYAQKRADMTAALKLAIEAGDQFELYYQPKTSVLTHKIDAVEALIRWRSPNFGMVPPGQFIALAEETGLIVPIGLWVLKQGLRDFLELQREGIQLEHISLNVSNVQLRNDETVAALKDVIAASGVAPDHIELEITESYIADDVNHAIGVLQSFRDMGVGLAIDDFGTGYSSMSYLKKLPVTRIKIDKSFVDGLPGSEDSITLTNSVIALAKNFGLAITAEGVELESQLVFLEQQCCDQIQGYYFSKPLPFNELKDYCRSSLKHSSKNSNVIQLQSVKSQ
ncbi:MAG: EAL domain-containing protein [Gallionella sp.]|jgi:diguanylate cyclase (GGDEF)-like protein